ncbi:MAG: DUF4956 domain-containing protein [Treponema sp.]|jgi:hypothetical protein|nr:DUF4956 domain-containing protein [Treponema sp.]
MFDFISGSVTNKMPDISGFLLCTVCSCVFGFAAAMLYMFRNKYSRSMAVTLVLLPVTVQVIIMVVNGNIGAGIAVAGAFSLVRFRSVPGNARDICSLFFAMALGLVTGMGFLFYAFIFLLMFAAVSLLLIFVRFGQGGTDIRVMRITIPENLDYDGLFDDILQKYTASFDLEKVRTTNMGSLYELTYLIRLKSASVPKEMIDALRCRNGNLNILISREQRDGEEL